MKIQTTGVPLLLLAMVGALSPFMLGHQAQLLILRQLVNIVVICLIRFLLSYWGDWQSTNPFMARD
jgi:hypothetical protein